MTIFPHICTEMPLPSTHDTDTVPRSDLSSTRTWIPPQIIYMP